MIRGSLRWASLDRVYVQGEYPVADVTDAYGGVYRAVRFLCGGSGRGSFTGGFGSATPSGSSAELQIDDDVSEVVLIFPEAGPGGLSRSMRPWILASQLHPEDAAQVTVETSPPDPDADYTAHHVTDWVSSRGDARVVVSEVAGLLLQGLPGQPVRVQVDGADHLRISSDGEAGETVPLSGPLRAYLDGLAEQVEQIRTALVGLENWANALPPVTLGNTPVGYQALPGDVAPDSEYAGTTAALESAVLKISSKSGG